MSVTFSVEHRAEEGRTTDEQDRAPQPTGAPAGSARPSGALRDRLRRGPCFGTFLKLPRPEVADVLALAGFDFVICDLEHAQITEVEAREVVRACVAAGLPVVVRLPDPEQGIVNRLLEAGAEGVQVPRMRTSAQADAARAMLRFPPEGQRSLGDANRLAGYGRTPVAELLPLANRRSLLIGQFETAELDDPPDPVLTPLDVAFIGPADLRIDLGSLPGQPATPAVADRIRLVEETAARTGAVLGTATRDPRAAERLVRSGYRFLAVGSDVGLLDHAATDLVQRLREIDAQTTRAEGEPPR